MEKRKYTFSVHTYAPELNKIYYAGIDITNKFPDRLVKTLTKDYRRNIRLIREYTGKPAPLHYICMTFVSSSGICRRTLQGAFDSWKDAIGAIREAERICGVGSRKDVKFIYQMI